MIVHIAYAAWSRLKLIFRRDPHGPIFKYRENPSPVGYAVQLNPDYSRARYEIRVCDEEGNVHPRCGTLNGPRFFYRDEALAYLRRFTNTEAQLLESGLHLDAQRRGKMDPLC